MSEGTADPSRRWLTHGRIEGGQSVLFLLSETEKPTSMSTITLKIPLKLDVCAHGVICNKQARALEAFLADLENDDRVWDSVSYSALQRLFQD